MKENAPAIDPEPRRLKTPETIRMFEMFADVIGYHLSTIDHLHAVETHLSDERETAALREQFIAVLGHDLRNPLMAIRSGVAMLGNALTYGAPDRPIRLNAAIIDGWLELSIANEGAPIPPAALDSIFEPFSRGALGPSKQGLGLGLYISSTIAKAHGGTLDVVSIPAETRFTFRMRIVPS